jgi:hypothetical protein
MSDELIADTRRGGMDEAVEILNNVRRIAAVLLSAKREATK